MPAPTPIPLTTDAPLTATTAALLLDGAQITQARFDVDAATLVLVLGDGQQVLFTPEYDSPLLAYALAAHNRI